MSSSLCFQQAKAHVEGTLRESWLTKVWYRGIGLSCNSNKAASCQGTLTSLITKSHLRRYLLLDEASCDLKILFFTAFAFLFLQVQPLAAERLHIINSHDLGKKFDRSAVRILQENKKGCVF